MQTLILETTCLIFLKLYEQHAIRGQPNLVCFNFLSLTIQMWLQSSEVGTTLSLYVTALQTSDMGILLASFRIVS